ncbi:MAG TPA: hypothetical protein ENK16_09115 [Chromatiales bacterium]|nr:hypothetical protein [Chromatiales bacterium]
MNSSRIPADGPRRFAITALIIIAAGAVAAPALVYAIGSLLGPYEGPDGFIGFLASVYSDALHGKLAAVGLLLSPAAFVFSWWLIVLAWRHDWNQSAHQQS